MELQEWQDQVRKLNSNFRNDPIRPETALAWYDDGDLDTKPPWLVSLAVLRIVRSHDFPPRAVAGLLRVLEEVRGELARERAEDATRTCAGCCTEDIAGWIDTGEGWAPCPDCRPGRHEAFALTRKSGHTLNATGRNYMIAPLDKATGFPKGRGEP
jgi:hypothetical protein